jgi:lipoprotein-anchoring transpeptidase ErfK/SrfK
LTVAVAVFVTAASVATGCGGPRPTLGAVPPHRLSPAGRAGPASTSTTSTTAPTTTTIAPTTTAPSTTGGATTGIATTAPPNRRNVGPADLLGYIATPNGAPSVYRQPDQSASRLDVKPRTDAGAPTTFAIVGDASDPARLPHPGWYEVLLASRPNGSTAWVPSTSVTVTRTPMRLFIDVRGRSLRIESDSKTVLTVPVAVGTTTNPTPTGGTYVTELIQNVEPNGAYGPYAFGLALHSDTLTEFAGGNGQVGIHGTNQPELIGQAVSHGCVRLSNESVAKVVGLRLPLGAPVFIT